MRCLLTLGCVLGLSMGGLAWSKENSPSPRPKRTYAIEQVQAMQDPAPQPPPAAPARPGAVVETLPGPAAPGAYQGGGYHGGEYVDGPYQAGSHCQFGCYGPDACACGGGCDDCCGGCFDDCCDCGQWGAGYAFVFLQPHFEDNPAFLRGDVFAANNNNRFVQQRAVADEFEYDLELSPRVWLEYTHCNGIGGRITYFQFDHNSNSELSIADNNTQFINVPAPLQNFGAIQPGDQFLADSSLELHVLDLEGTKRIDFGCWNLMVTSGLRYVSLNQQYRANLYDLNDVQLEWYQAGHRFDGWGPSFGFEARRLLGGCFQVFSSARASLLYGNAKRATISIDQINAVAVDTYVERNDLLTIGELQLGLEWRKCTCSGKELLCRTALEGQVWQGAGGAVGEDGDLGLIGFNVALGLGW